MFIRKATVIPFIALAALAARSGDAAAQDAASILQSAREAIGKELPTRLRITAAGSGYASGPDSSARQHYRIERYVQELDMNARTASEQVVRANPADAEHGRPEAQTKTVKADAPWSEQHVLWMTPLGFLTGAAAQPLTTGSETLLGTSYRVVTFNVPGGYPVHGYVSDENVLERARTDVGDVQLESVFMDWKDFGGIKYPSLILEKTNGQVARILVVQGLERF